MGERGRRNQELAKLRRALKADPANIELANRYWSALADIGPGSADFFPRFITLKSRSSCLSMEFKAA